MPLALRGKGPESTAARGPHVEAHTLSTDQLQALILEALAFSSMRDREDEVAEAHKRTFEWIFDEKALIESPESKASGPGSHFLQWLRDKSGDEGGIYWINGKAGSGKSTLLRFIYNHEKTLHNLGVWAGPRPFTMAGFFFWTSGSFEQRSQAGLLRSLLHQLLGEHRDLIPTTFPDVWQRYLAMTTKERIKAPISWSLLELMQGLRCFLEHAVKKVNICLFIDGLDEFDGDHDEIIQLFTNIVRDGKQSIKVCLSSRPWSVFEAAFKSIPHLELQNLTLKDRQHYVADKFYSDAKMLQLLQREPQTSSALMEEVVQRADGVFLWVILTVRFLIGHIQTDDKVSDITVRLHQLPTDLEKFFGHMLFKIQEKEVTITASQLFQLIRAREVVCNFTGDHAASSPTLWELALACLHDREVILRGTVRQPSNEEIAGICNKTKDQIDGTCAGLLEIHPKNSRHNRSAIRLAKHEDPENNQSLVHSKVTYLHRTVRDWLVYSPSIWDTILQYTASASYDPHISHLCSYVLQLKLPLEELEHHRRLDEWWEGIVLSLTHARYISQASESQINAISIIDELDRTLCFYWLPKPSQPDDHWARNAFESYEVRSQHKAVISHPFLSLTTKFGLLFYVSAKISLAGENPSNIGYHGGRTLLSYATNFLVNRRRTVFPLSEPAFVKSLLSAGQDPNLQYSNFAGKNETPWLNCLRHVREALRRGWISVKDGQLQRWKLILLLFIEHGAEVNAVLATDRWDPEITALGVVDAVYEEFEVEEVGRLRDAMLLKGARSTITEEHNSHGLAGDYEGRIFGLS